MEDIHNLINICAANTIQPTWNFWRFCMCPSNDTFDKNKNLHAGTGGSTAKTVSLLGIKQSQSAPHTANRNSTTFQIHLLVWKSLYFHCISLKFVPQEPITNMPSLVQIVVPLRRGDKSLSESMMAYFSAAYIRHSIAMSQSYGHYHATFTNHLAK